MTELRTAAVLGADRPFGAEIVARLEAGGYAVHTVADAAGVTAAGPLDVFVFNAPVAPEYTAFGDITDADFMTVVDEQLFTLVAAGQAAARAMSRGGSIVHVSSRAHLGGWGGAHRIAAGTALVGMSRSMSLELEPLGIRVNVVAPDFVGGPGDTPERRIELAGVVAFLAGPDSNAITGETTLVNGGHSLRMTEGARRR